MTDLRRHVPRVALDWDDVAPGRSWQVLDATMVFADISGFTALTERLAKRGRIGAEELIETLNRVFGAMLSQAAIRDGELLKFGGDALLFLFRGEDHASRACRSAVDMRQALKEAAKIPTSVGRLKLKMSVGIHTGPVDLFLVGAPTRELLILGAAGTSTAEAEHAAVAGEILVTAGTAERLPKGSTQLREDGLHRLKWRFTYPPEGEGLPTPEVTEERLRTLFPNALGDYLAERVPDPEHKVATIGFARFSGTDALLVSDGHEAVADALHRTISVFEDAMIAEGVTLLATDLDSDGGKLFMGSGVPYSTEDDEGRMLRAMRRVIDTGTPLPVQIGVNRGHVFAAEVGTPDRAAYSAMGDTTNTAARIMSKAPAGVLYAHPSVLEQSRTLFATEPAGPFPMKGKTVPVLVNDVGDELGIRQAQTRSDLPLVGREEELATLRDAVQTALSGEGGIVTIAAPTGLGKSRLVREALSGVKVTRVEVRGEPYGMTSPYRMLRDPVRQAFGVERAAPEEMAAQLLAAFERLLPDLAPFAPLLEDVVNIPLPPTRQASAIEPQYRPDRIADLILQLVERTVPGPFVLEVEEAHWADSASILVLRRIAEAAAGRPWLVIVSRRDESGGLDPERGTRLTLGPLSDDVLTRIVIEATEADPLRPHEVDGIVARAGGNPLYVEELVRVFREVGSLDEIPQSLAAALDAQIDALDPNTRRVMRYASVLGRSFRRAVLDETLRGDDLVVDDLILDKLSAFVEPDGNGRLRFRTGMIRDAAYEGLAYRLRAKLHASAGRAVERLSDDLEADADTLSLHFWRAADQPKTWRYAALAGDRAARAYANVDAAIQYQRALDAARTLPGVPVAEKVRMWQQLGEVRDLAGLYEDAIDAFTQGLRLVPKASDEAVELTLRRVRTRIRLGSYQSALAEVTRMESLLESSDLPDVRPALVRLKGLRANIRLYQQRLTQALVAIRGLVEQARATGEFDVLEQVLIISDAARFQLGDTSVGQDTEEALVSALQHGRLARASVASGNLGANAFYVGRWDTAVERYLESQSTALAVGDVVGAAIVGINLGEIYVFRHQLDEADEVLAGSTRVLRTSGDHFMAAYCGMLQARSLLARGDAAAAEHLAREVADEITAMGQRATALEASLVQVEALTRQGRAAESLALLDELSESATGEGTMLRPRLHLERARALAATSDLDAATVEIDEGIALARSHNLAHDEAMLLQVRADVRSALGDADSAAESSAAATAILVGLGVEVAHA